MVAASYVNRRGTDIYSTLQGVSQPSHFGTTSYPLTEGSASSRIAESSSRYAVKRSLARRVASPPRSGKDHLGSFWDGRCRSFRLLGVNSLPSLFLTREEAGTSGVRRIGTRVASWSPVCFPPLRTTSSFTAEDTDRVSGSDPCCSIVAPHVLVLRHSTSPGLTSPGASTQMRSSVTGSGNTAPPISSGTEAVGLAPEKAQLLAMGLSEPVVHTLKSARAPSTRTLYSYSWACSIPDILEFLQEHLDSGKSPTTLRGLVAAISAAGGSRWRRWSRVFLLMMAGC